MVQRFFQSLLAQTAKLENVEVVLYLDRDDPGSHGITCDGFGLVKIIGPRASMGSYNSACLSRSSGEIVILMNDDVIVRTPGWDDQIIKFASDIADGIFLAYGNDLHMGKRMCTFPILSRKTCDLLIKPYPEEYQGGFIDWHLFDIFRRLKYMGHDRIFYLENVIFEHFHYTVGKADFDTTYRSKDYYADDWTFICLQDLRQRAAQRLRASILGSPLPELSGPRGLAARPNGLAGILARYARVSLLDFSLPPEERVRLWIWLTGRYLRSRGYLPPRRPLRRAD